MKKKLLSAAFGLATLLIATASFAANNSNEKSVLASPDAKIEKVADGTIAKAGNITTAYNSNGDWVYTIERFNADNLPKDIFDIVRNGYEHYYISGIEKIDQPGFSTVYIAHLQNDISVKTVRVSEGETELVEDYVKG